MNVTEINSAEIGNGQSAPNVFVNLAVTAVASVSMAVRRTLHMAGYIAPSASYAAIFGRIQYMMATITASAIPTLDALRHRFATSSITATAFVSVAASKVVGTFLSGNTSALAATSFVASAMRHFIASVAATASSLNDFRKAVLMQGAKTATASTVIYTAFAGERAPDERTMLVQQESRTMGVPQ